MLNSDISIPANGNEKPREAVDAASRGLECCAGLRGLRLRVSSITGWHNPSIEQPAYQVKNFVVLHFAM
jgi:hypothetical protein